MREDEKHRTIHGSPADSPQEDAGEVGRSEIRASATHARPRPRSRPVAAISRWWTRPLLRRAHEQSSPVCFPPRGRPTLASRAWSAQPERPSALGAHAAAHRPMVTSGPHLPPLSPEATWRHYLRQEPDAGNPLVRIRGGGHGRPCFLLRLPPTRLVARMLREICGAGGRGAGL